VRRFLAAPLILGIVSSAIQLAAQLPKTGTWVEVSEGSASGEGIGDTRSVESGDTARQSLAIDTSGHPLVAWTSRGSARLHRPGASEASLG